MLCHVIVFWTVLGELGKFSIFRNYGTVFQGVVLHVYERVYKYVHELILVTSLDLVRLGSQSKYRVILIPPF